MRTDGHLHSSFSDGLNTPEEMVIKALELGYKEIVFADHVRRTTDWIPEYVAEIRRLNAKYTDIAIYVGIEAKVIDLDGHLDVRNDLYQQVDFVLAAFHRIPCGANAFLTSNQIYRDRNKACALWTEAMLRLLEYGRFSWIAHPTGILSRYHIDLTEELELEIAEKAAEATCIMEISCKRGVPTKRFRKLLLQTGVPLIWGSDSHSIADLVDCTRQYDGCDQSVVIPSEVLSRRKLA